MKHGANNAVEYHGKRIKILHGCPFEGWPFNGQTANFILKPPKVIESKTFSIMLYYNISTTYLKIGDLFCLVIFLDFRTVCIVARCSYALIYNTVIIFNIKGGYNLSTWPWFRQRTFIFPTPSSWGLARAIFLVLCQMYSTRFSTCQTWKYVTK